MSAKRRGLGKGLDALLGPAVTEATVPPSGDVRDIGIDLLKKGRHQPRLDIRKETLEDLANSIRAQGVMQPLLVRPTHDGGEAEYEIIAGERRWRAAQLAGLESVPALVRDVPDETAIAMALIENIQREDLNPLEEARALSRLTEEFGLTHQEAAESVGRSRTTVTNLMRLLELNEEVQNLVEIRELEMGHARALLALPMTAQPAAAHEVIRRGLSVRETERLVKRLAAGRSKKTEQPTDPNVRSLEKELTDKLGARVSIRQSASGKGKLEILYNNLDELDGILAHIK